MHQALSGVNAQIESWPLIETLISEDDPEMNHFIDNIENYEWIVFSSKRAIESFQPYIQDQKLSDSIIARLKFCAIGKDIEFMQNTLHVEPAIRPLEPSPTGIVQALKDLPEDIQNVKIAVLAPDVKGISEPNVVPNFLNDLRQLGMYVQKINAYTTAASGISNDPEKINAILNGKYSIIAFTSTAEVEVFLKRIDIKTLPSSVKFACFGPYTAANARSLGIQVDIVARDFSSFEGFAKEIGNYLAEH